MANLATRPLDRSIRSSALPKDSRKGMLLVLPVPFRSVNGQLFFEAQACNGLEQWADSFGFITVAGLLMPEHLAAQQTTIVWRDTATLADPQRFEFVPLPWAYSIPRFLSHHRSTQALLGRLIQRSRYLQFCIGGLVGDWAAVAAIAAHQQKRAYAIHTDWVEHKHLLQVTKDASLPKRSKAVVLSFLWKSIMLGLFAAQH
jgi:hypothetical protein